MRTCWSSEARGTDGPPRQSGGRSASIWPGTRPARWSSYVPRRARTQHASSSESTAPRRAARRSKFAFRRANLTKESVVALHAWKAGHVDLDGRGQLPSTVAKRSQAADAALAEYVADLHADHPDVALEMDTIALPPALALTETSAHASLVVTGSRGRGVFAGLLLGSVSHHLLHRAHCPVAVVR